MGLRDFRFVKYTTLFLDVRYKWPLIELKASCRFVSDAFLQVSFSNLSLSKIVHFALVETTFTKYWISSNKRPRKLLDVAFIRGWR